MHLSHWQIRKLMKSQTNWNVKGHTHDEGSRADVRTCRCVPLTWQRCTTILYRSSEMHAQKQEKKWVNTRERGGLGLRYRERERERHTQLQWKKLSWVNVELRIEWEEDASRSGHGRRSGWWKMRWDCWVKRSWVTSRLASRTLGTMCGRQRPSMSMTLCSLSAIRDTCETRIRELGTKMSPHKGKQRKSRQTFHLNHTCLKNTA